MCDGCAGGCVYFLSAMVTQGVVCVFAWSYSCTCYCVTLPPIWCLLAESYVYLFLSAMVARIAVLMMDISSNYLSTGSWGKIAVKSINSARQALVNMKWHPCINAFSYSTMLKSKCCYLIGIGIKFLWSLHLFPILQSFWGVWDYCWLEDFYAWIYLVTLFTTMSYTSPLRLHPDLLYYNS